MLLHWVLGWIISTHFNIVKKGSHLEPFSCFDSFRDGLQIFFSFSGECRRLMWSWCCSQMCVCACEYDRERELMSLSIPIPIQFRFSCETFTVNVSLSPHPPPHMTSSKPLITASLALLSLWQRSNQAALLQVCHVPKTNIAGKTWVLLTFKYRLEHKAPKPCYWCCFPLRIGRSQCFHQIWMNIAAFKLTNAPTLLSSIIMLNF